MESLWPITLILFVAANDSSDAVKPKDQSPQTSVWALVDALERAVPFSQRTLEGVLHTKLRLEVSAPTAIAFVAERAGPQRLNVVYVSVVGSTADGGGDALWIEVPDARVSMAEVEKRYPGGKRDSGETRSKATSERAVKEYSVERAWGTLYFGALVTRPDALATLGFRVATGLASEAGRPCETRPKVLPDKKRSARAGWAATCSEVERCLAEEKARLLGSSRKIPIELAAEPVHLRSTGMLSSRDACSKAAKRFNFRDGGDGACFVNAFVRRGDVVEDLATGLCWTTDISEEVDIRGATKYLEGLNRHKFAGFSGWRLPTIDELLSIVESLDSQTVAEEHVANWPRIDGHLFRTRDGDTGPKRLWTSDYYDVSEDPSPYRVRLSVDVQWGRCTAVPEKLFAAVRAVRTLSQSEFVDAKRGFLESK